ncbi:MAG: hypothetical protein QW453_03420 [Thermoprotei archaeon]
MYYGIYVLGDNMEYIEKIIGNYRLRVFNINKLLIGIPIDIGPRILYLTTTEDPDFNLFNILPEITVETPEGIWHIHGGHRLWTSPEDMPRTYSLDDKPVKLENRNDKVTIIGNPEYNNNVLKKIHIEPGDEEYSVKVTHEIVNIGRWPIEYACWALSVMRNNGFAVIPVKPKRVDPHGLLPDRYIVIWPYTILRDPRLYLLDTYIAIRQDTSIPRALKISTKANPNWIAYWVQGYAFIKKFIEEKAQYPDYGSTVEVYTNDKFLELETVGPLKRIHPGDSNIHVEIWKVMKIGDLEISEEDFEKKLYKV